ncbi:MAG: YigZ family protein [Candidatus Nanoarchaeia archaeon]
MKKNENTSDFILLSTSSHNVKKSTFESQLFLIQSLDDVSLIINQLNKEHPKASHICYCARFDDEVIIKNDREVGDPANIARNILYYNNLNSHVLVTIR